MKYFDTEMWKDITETPSKLKNIRSVNEKTMEQLVCAIRDSKMTNFIVCARGTSNNALVFFKYALEIGSNYTVGFSAPSVLTLYNGKINFTNSIILGVSQSGESSDVVEVIKKASNQGAITIAITNNENSSCARYAKYHLFCNVGPKNCVVATKTFTAELYLLLWLASILGYNWDINSELKNLSANLNSVMSQIDEDTTKYAKMFKHMEGGFILSRGLTYAISLEASLKLQETCGIQMKGFPSSEFFHGPSAMVSSDTPIFIFAPKPYEAEDDDLESLIRADQIKLIEKILPLGAPVLLITNDPVLVGKYEELKEVLIHFNCPEELSVFPFAIFAQMFACKMCCNNNGNPDNPNDIKKFPDFM